jgi:hypothetical protein
MKPVFTWLALFVSVFLCMGADSQSSDTNIVGLLREFGFPIFVSLWFMWRVEKRMDRFTDNIQNLLMAITVMAKTVDSLPTGQSASYLPPAQPRPPTQL